MNNDWVVMEESLFSRGGLSLDRLSSLCELAQHGSLAKAAKGDVVRQSQFSRQLRELGEFFGVELTRRRGKGVELTPAGKELAALGREILGGLESFRRSQRGEAHVVRIGAGESLIQWQVLPRLSTLRRALPNTLIVLKNRRGGEILTELLESELDFGLVDHEELPAGMGSVRLGTVRYALFVRNGFAVRPKWREVLDLPWVGLEGEGRLMRAFQKTAEKLGVALKASVQCSSFPTVARALTETEGFAVLPVAAKQDSLVPIEAPFLREFDRDIRLVWSNRRMLVHREMERWKLRLGAELTW